MEDGEDGWDMRLVELGGGEEEGRMVVVGDARKSDSAAWWVLWVSYVRSGACFVACDLTHER